MSREAGGNDVLLEELCAVYPSNDSLFQSILTLMKGSDPRKVASLILQLAGGIGGFLSIAQAETILIKAKDEGLSVHYIQNNVVKLCNQPWDVNSELGGCGVCYYGNFGDRPFLQKAIDILNYNFKMRKDINAL
jgi:hypothetical protein